VVVLAGGGGVRVGLAEFSFPFQPAIIGRRALC
jgi:hypothetical protein